MKCLYLAADLFQYVCAGSTFGTDERLNGCLIVCPDGDVSFLASFNAEGLLRDL